MTGFDFPPPAMPPGTDALRAEVRAFLAESQADLGWRPDSDFGSDWSAVLQPFAGRAGLDRHVLAQALRRARALGAGALRRDRGAAGGRAPVYAHWVADRQSGPLLLRFGSEAQRQTILPRIAAGECYFAIGMSEPDSGSDLASVRTRAERTADGWRIDGTKVWTSNAHRSQYMIALCRTGPAGESRHEGLSQFLIDLEADGVKVTPSSTSPASTTSTSASSRT